MNDFQLGRLFGFPITVQPSALAILALFVLLGARDGAGSAGMGLLLAAMVFGSVLVHELGHAFAGRAFGLAPLGITLHGFGGMTRFDHAPRPKPGVIVTLAGPFAGLLLGVVALVVALVVDLPVVEPVVWRAAEFNLFWSLFNLLPMYPLDGGLVTFHGLSLWIPARDALSWAARVGVLVAVAVGTVALLASEIFIGIIALMSLAQSVPLAMTRPDAGR